MDNTYTDVMTDIETQGLQPDRSGMIQLAAVKFNLKERTVSPNFFNRSLIVPHWRGWDESTRSWWAKMPELYQKIISTAEDPAVVMRDFADWSIQPGTQLRFWSKPTSFDFAFVSSYLRDFNQPAIYDFREATDLNSYFRGLYAPNDIDREGEPKLTSGAHDAIRDTLHQIKLLFHHADKVANAAKS